MPSPAPQMLTKTTKRQIQMVYSQISSEIEALETNSIHYAKPQNRYYSLLIPCLPPLLSSNRMKGLSYLRHAFLTLANSNMLDPEKKRYTNVGAALLWALDNAENAASYVGDDAPLLLIQALGTIVHVVTRLCNQEWGLESSIDDAYQVLDTSTSDVDFALRTEWALDMQVSQTSQKIESQHVKQELDEVIEEQYLHDLHRNVAREKCSIQTRADVRTSHPSLFTSIPDYMHRAGNSITRTERQRYIQNGCLMPLSTVLKVYEPEKNHVSARFKQEYVEMKYKDKKLFECVSIRCARLSHENMRRDFAAKQENPEGARLSSIEMDVSQHRAMIKLCKKAYLENFPKSKPKLLMGIPKHFPGVRAQVPVLILPSCFVRVHDGEQFMEWPIRKALEMCQHDLYGIAMLEVQFVDRVDGTLIKISLMGIVVERDLLNYDDPVFGILDKGRLHEGEDQEALQKR